MASTSLLYHAFGLVDYTHRKVEYKKGKTWFHIAMKETKRRCASCGSRDVTKEGPFTRAFREVPIGNRPTMLVLHGHRHLCGKCGELRQEPIRFADPYKRYTRRFARYLIGLTYAMAMVQVARHLKVSWDLVKDIVSIYLHRKVKRRRLSKVRYLAVDEFSIRKGHIYMTVVMDLETGIILHVAMGREAAALIPFLWRLKRANAPLKAVAMDMWKAYRKAFKTVFPSLDIVHDPYHVVALLNKAVDEVRRELYRDLKGEQRDVLKGTRFLLLKGLEHVSETQLERLMILMEMNQPLYEVYLLKEDFRRFWDFSDRLSAMEFLTQWLEQAVETNFPSIIQFALTVIRHIDGLLNYFTHRITTGPLEGMNNKIKVFKRVAYGYRDFSFFALRLLFLHESTYAVTG